MRFYETILKYPKVTIGIILLITLFLEWETRQVELNNSVEALLPVHHPSVLQDKEIKHAFNSREMILIGVINKATLKKFAEIRDGLNAQQKYIHICVWCT